MEMRVRVLLRALNEPGRTRWDPQDGMMRLGIRAHRVEDMGSMVADFLYARGRSDSLHDDGDALKRVSKVVVVALLINTRNNNGQTSFYDKAGQKE